MMMTQFFFFLSPKRYPLLPSSLQLKLVFCSQFSSIFWALTFGWCCKWDSVKSWCILLSFFPSHLSTKKNYNIISSHVLWSESPLLRPNGSCSSLIFPGNWDKRLILKRQIYLAGALLVKTCLRLSLIHVTIQFLLSCSHSSLSPLSLMA